MFHKKRFRSAVALIVTFLLIILITISATAVLAQGPVDPTPPPPALPVDPTPDALSPPALPVDPTAPSDAPDNGDNGDKTVMPLSYSWLPPNGIVRHAATPVQISAYGGVLNVYFIGADGVVASGVVIASFRDLAEMHPGGGAVSLFTGVNSGSGKAVMIDYLPEEMKIRVSTFYADKPPHDYNKPYIFTVDADHTVSHESW